jgi:hypothetical protein
MLNTITQLIQELSANPAFFIAAFAVAWIASIVLICRFLSMSRGEE